MTGLRAVLMLAALALPTIAHAQSSFLARVDRTTVGLGEVFAFEVTLSAEDARAPSYRPPDFKGFRVLAERPSQQTQIQMGGGANFVRTVLSWRYDLTPLAKGTLTIGPARVRAGGRELKTDAITITVTDGPGPGAAAPAAPRRRGLPGFGGLGSPFDDLFGDQPSAPPPGAGDGGNLLKVVVDKQRPYVGEPIIVEWFLYLTERQDKYQALAEPRTDGFWSEDLPVPSAQGSLALTQQYVDGRLYLVAPLMRRALFPLQPGKLTVTPLKAEISQVDFFGRSLRTQKLEAEPLTIEAQPLPTEGRPPDFDPASVGRFTVAARVDRDRVAVGEAVTLTVSVTGQGNLRKLVPPRLPALPGWKTYDPKVDVKLDKDSGISGSKTMEYLLLPEKPGTTTIPELAFPHFDPAAKAYVTQKSAPVRIEVTTDAATGTKPGAGAASAGMAGLENVLPTEIRPPRTRASLRRDLGTTFYRSRAFVVLLLALPSAFGLTVLVGRVRERLSQETERGRRRKTRRLVRRHLRAAEAHLEGGATSPFYIEIDRVLREVLTARLGRPVAGMSREELREVLARSGLGETLAERVITELEECDRARFAPGSMGTGDMKATLERAADLILQVEKAPLRQEVAA